MKKPFVALGIPSTYACHCVFGRRGRGVWVKLIEAQWLNVYVSATLPLVI